MAEWLKALAWKACIRETVSWVRIPLPPPSVLEARSPVRNRPQTTIRLARRRNFVYINSPPWPARRQPRTAPSMQGRPTATIISALSRRMVACCHSGQRSVAALVEKDPKPYRARSLRGCPESRFCCRHDRCRKAPDPIPTRIGVPGVSIAILRRLTARDVRCLGRDVQTADRQTS